jgi:hypothetical protein
MSTNGLEKAIEEIRETAKGSEKQRLTRLELAVQGIKQRLDDIEQNHRRNQNE